jgi:hypothetical protein
VTLLSYPEKELVGKSLKDLLPRRFHEERERDLARLRAAGAPSPALRWAASYVLNRAGEEVPAALHLRAFDENGQRVLGVALCRRDEGE